MGSRSHKSILSSPNSGSRQNLPCYPPQFPRACASILVSPLCVTRCPVSSDRGVRSIGLCGGRGGVSSTIIRVWRRASLTKSALSGCQSKPPPRDERSSGTHSEQSHSGSFPPSKAYPEIWSAGVAAGGITYFFFHLALRELIVSLVFTA